jgi:A/G-specific adenine glycosylase
MPSKSNIQAARAARFRRRLAAWYRRFGRDLPWRRTRDPYAIVVSEFMLQQTQVRRVMDYYPRFLERYPTVQHLAAARPAAVREAWDGLGYYRRAANLGRLARAVVREHEGRVPSDLGALRRLPGVGPYTAGAIACFAYEQAAPAVDTNVARVLRRFFGMPRRTRKTRALSEARRLRELALALQPRRGRAAWTFNQALMELGALVCVARKPKCGDCPVRADCRWLSRQPVGFSTAK